MELQTFMKFESCWAATFLSHMQASKNKFNLKATILKNDSMCIKEWTQLCKFVAMCIVHLEAYTLTNENGFSREKFFEWKWVWGKGLELQNQRQLGQRSSDLGGNDLPQIL